MDSWPETSVKEVKAKTGRRRGGSKDKSIELIFLAVLAAIFLAMGEAIGSVIKG